MHVIPSGKKDFFLILILKTNLNMSIPGNDINSQT